MAAPFIVWRDMHRRDNDVFEWLRQRARLVDGVPVVRATQEEIAAEFGCHRHTVRNIMHRLIGAELIAPASTVKTEGYTYKINAR